MPELPEVETVRRSLLPVLKGQTINKVDIFSPVVTLPDAAIFQQLIGRTVKDIQRRGKYLIVLFDAGAPLTVHLRMTGKLLWRQPEEPIAKHTHVIFTYACHKQLRFVDVRRFGRLWLGDPNTIPGLATLGKEPIAPDFSPEVLAQALSHHQKGKIKAVILDQTVVAGLGNIYADEALFAAAIHPETPAGALLSQDIQNLAYSMTFVLEEGIKYRGTSIRDYVDGQGEKGENQLRLQVFQREGQPCPCCGTPIRRTRVAGRSSYFCPACQKK